MRSERRHCAAHTIIEIVTVFALSTIFFAIAGGVVMTCHRIATRGAEHLIQVREVRAFADRLRRDVHAATGHTVASAAEPEEDAILRMDLPGGEHIAYRWRNESVVRERRIEGQPSEVRSCLHGVEEVVAEPRIAGRHVIGIGWSVRFRPPAQRLWNVRRDYRGMAAFRTQEAP